MSALPAGLQPGEIPTPESLRFMLLATQREAWGGITVASAVAGASGEEAAMQIAALAEMDSGATTPRWQPEAEAVAAGIFLALARGDAGRRVRRIMEAEVDVAGALRAYLG